MGWETGTTSDKLFEMFYRQTACFHVLDSHRVTVYQGKLLNCSGLYSSNL